LLALGLLCNFLVRPVAERHYMSDEELEAERRIAHDAANRAKGNPYDTTPPRSEQKRSSPAVVALCWLAVGAPIAWGVITTLAKAAVLFR
jgi:hypothetical protein